MDIAGNWPAAEMATVSIRRACSGGTMLQFAADFVFTRLEAGQELTRLSAEFTVPDTYETGPGAGTAIPATDLRLVGLSMFALLDGPEQAPPVWPADQPLL